MAKSTTMTKMKKEDPERYARIRRSQKRIRDKEHEEAAKGRERTPYPSLRNVIQDIGKRKSEIKKSYKY